MDSIVDHLCLHSMVANLAGASAGDMRKLMKLKTEVREHSLQVYICSFVSVFLVATHMYTYI
jgi:hypothetical protein